MPLSHSYVDLSYSVARFDKSQKGQTPEQGTVWNNKGGTGKTTVVFQTAANYAKLHPETKVIVIDMCPQANVSTTLLASFIKTEGTEENVPKEQKVTTRVTSTKNPDKGYAKSVYGYLLARLDGENPDTISYNDFLTKVKGFNENIAENLFLLRGDFYLEAVSVRLHDEREKSPSNQDKPDEPWKKVTLFVKDFVDQISADETSYVFFIDTNPSFSIYTELAISAADRLIVPFTPDYFSVAAIGAMFYFVYGVGDNPRQENKESGLLEKQYHHRADCYKIERPKIHLFINNRGTFYRKQSSATFAVTEKMVLSLVKEVVESKSLISDYYNNDNHKFEDHIIFNLRDFHKMAVLSLYFCCPLCSFVVGKYTMCYGTQTDEESDDDKHDEVGDNTSIRVTELDIKGYALAIENLTEMLS